MSEDVTIDETAAMIIRAVAKAKGISFSKALVMVCKSYAGQENADG